MSNTEFKNVIVLKTDGSILLSKLKKTIDINNLEIKDIADILKIKGKGKLERHCDWKLARHTISVYGWKDGAAGKENKTELPPPEDSDLYFGDILLIKNNEKKILSISLKDYENFKEKAFGGFEDLGEDDTDSDTEPNEYDLNDSFIDDSPQVDNYDEVSESSMSDRITDEDSEENNLSDVFDDSEYEEHDSKNEE